MDRVAKYSKLQPQLFIKFCPNAYHIEYMVFDLTKIPLCSFLLFFLFSGSHQFSETLNYFSVCLDWDQGICIIDKHSTY